MVGYFSNPFCSIDQNLCYFQVIVIEQYQSTLRVTFVVTNHVEQTYSI